MKKAAYSINEFSKISTISRTTIYRKIRAGKIPACKLGSGRVLIPASFVESIFGISEEV